MWQGISRNWVLREDGSAVCVNVLKNEFSDDSSILSAFYSILDAIPEHFSLNGSNSFSFGNGFLFGEGGKWHEVNSEEKY